MKLDIQSEIVFTTARSGGKGGQNVNKVETMVQGYWYPAASQLLASSQKEKLLHQLQYQLSKEGALQIKSQQHRSQLANKLAVIDKMNAVVNQALQPKKSRLATQPTAASKHKKRAQKEIQSQRKASRNWRREEE